MSKEEIYEVITKVAKNHCKKKFAYLTEDDIENKAWEIALKQLPEFVVSKGKAKNPAKSLEHWLNAVVSNRLKNYYRDEFEVKNKSQIVSPVSLDTTMDTPDLNIGFVDIYNSEFWNLIIRNLSDNYLDILEAILSGEKVNTYYKNKLQTKIKVIWKTKWNNQNERMSR